MRLDLRTRQLHERLYLANAVIVITHQIDAAYWHEWRLFNLPGGIGLFLLLNLPIVFSILYGARVVALGLRSGIVISWALVAGGLFAAGFHSFHLLRGDEAFTLPVSIALLATTLFLSVAQAAGLLMLQRDPGRAFSDIGRPAA